MASALTFQSGLSSVATSHHMAVHFQEHASNKRTTWRDTTMFTKLVSFHKFAEWARFEHIHLVDSSFSIWDLHPDILTRPYTSRSSRIIDPSGAPAEPSGGDSAYNSSRRALGVFLQEGFLAVSQQAFRSSRCENVHHAENGRDFRGRTTALDFVNVRILETTCAPSGLGDMSTVGFFSAKHQSRRDNTLLFAA